MAKDKILTPDEIFEQAESYLNDEDIRFIREAYQYAVKAHEGQFRKSGEPYIIHPVQVAGILIDLKLDPETIAGGFFA